MEYKFHEGDNAGSKESLEKGSYYAVDATTVVPEGIPQAKKIKAEDIYRFKDQWNFSSLRADVWAQWWADRINEFFGVK